MKHFNVRAYGVCIEANSLLVTDEIRYGTRMTKLPGGGLEFGEGLESCLKREWMEELSAEIEVGDVLFVNPFLQISVFDPNHEVLCLYFRVYPMSPLQGRFTEKPMDFHDNAEGEQVFRWVEVASLTDRTFTFPIDQALVPKLKGLI
ncbi:MAG: NUDIX domain-containing protein [Bacteroidota bacterium]